MNITQKILLLGLLLFSSIVFGQNVPPPAPPPPGEAPIDGILWLGGIVALTYGAIKKYKNSKE